MSVNTGCGILLYRIILSLVGYRRDKVGCRVLLTPRWVVFLIVALALSVGITHRLAKARATIRKTTRQDVRSTLHPTLSCRYPTNDRMLRYRRMLHPVFTDTLYSGCVSAAGMKYAQAYYTSFGWFRCHPMKARSEAQETLSLMFKRDDVLPRMIVDDSSPSRDQDSIM